MQPPARPAGVVLDPHVIGEVAQADAPLARRGVIGRHRHVHRVVDQVPPLDPLVETVELRLREVAVLEHEASSSSAPRSMATASSGSFSMKVSSTRVAAGEERHRRRQRRSCGGEGRHAHAAAAHARDRPSPASAAARRAITTSACSTSARPASVSVTPRLPRWTSVALACFSSAAICCGDRGCVGQGVRRSREGAVLRDRLQNLQLLDVRSITRAYRRPHNFEFELMALVGDHCLRDQPQTKGHR